MSVRRETKAEFTDGLLKIAGEAYSVDDGGDVITNGEQVRRLIWRAALGWTETVKADDGSLREIKHPPAVWAQQFVFERIVGKAGPMVPDVADGIRAADKVRELSRNRINAMASAAIGPPKTKSPKSDKGDVQ